MARNMGRTCGGDDGLAASLVEFCDDFEEHQHELDHAAIDQAIKAADALAAAGRFDLAAFESLRQRIVEAVPAHCGSIAETYVGMVRALLPRAALPMDRERKGR